MTSARLGSVTPFQNDLTESPALCFPQEEIISEPVSGLTLQSLREVEPSLPLLGPEGRPSRL